MGQRAPGATSRVDAAQPAFSHGHAGHGAAQPAGVPVRIHTLGRFTLAIDGRMVCAPGKSQKRPLALLKALICLGGREVALSRLGECIWPDADGDLCVRNLTVTLHRLRHLLGIRGVVLQQEGKLSLNDELCWVDAWQFERCANQGLVLLDDAATASLALAQLRAALALYCGHFLGREADEAWMLAPRLRLRIRFERLVGRLSGFLEDCERHGEAVDICLQALERDPLDEAIYRRLMRCYLRGGEYSRALLTYRRCREALGNGLEAQPSTQTGELYLEALRAANRTGADRHNAAPHRDGVLATIGRGRRQA